MLDGTRQPTIPELNPSAITQVQKINIWRQRASELYTSLTMFITNTLVLLAFLFNFLPSWLVSKPHQPYDAIYSSLPPIDTFSEITEDSLIDSLRISFQVWRPHPMWKRKPPGPPDFHICIVDGHTPFPNLSQLEELYNSVAKSYPLGGKNGKVVLAVVDNGVSNYLTLDDTLLNTPSPSKSR